MHGRVLFPVPQLFLCTPDHAQSPISQIHCLSPVPYHQLLSLKSLSRKEFPSVNLSFAIFAKMCDLGHIIGSLIIFFIGVKEGCPIFQILLAVRSYIMHH
jgi:hypothetical protein